MAWLRKIPKSPYWQAIVYLPDGRKTTRSTGTTNKREAQQIAAQYEQSSQEGRSGLLTEKRVRKTLSDFYFIANKDKLQASTTEDYFRNWLKRKRLENSRLTAERYTSHVDRFLKHLGAKAKQDIMHLNSKDISKVLEKASEELATSTVNMMVKVIRAALKQAHRDGFVDTNEGTRVTLIKRSEKPKRRPFTLGEIRELLKAADFEWEGIILCGYYTGQRLGDIVLLTWENLDLVNSQLIFETKKTSRSMVIPIASALKRHFEKLPAGDNPVAPLFPSAYASRIRNDKVGPLSNQFRKIMVNADLVKAFDHKSKGKGRSAKREVSELSFHCLRHTTTSAFHNAGVGGAVAQDLIGHDSEAISRQYTHIDMAAKRRAIESLPDIL